MNDDPLIWFKNIQISKNPVLVSETFILSVSLVQLTPDDTTSLPFKLTGDKEAVRT